MADRTQARIVEMMTAPAAAGGLGATHMETHISHIFLAGDFAWKMKKAVKLDFVDFSTRARRLKACEDELTINRRTAPEIYLDLVTVHERDGALSLGPPGRPVDHMVRMRRFDQGDLMAEIAERGALTAAHARDIADQMAALHLSAARVAPGEATEPFATTLHDLTDRLGRAAAGGPLEAAAAAWRAAAEASLAACGPLIAARARHGALRHCHGDLHLRNICLFEGRVRLFDAIEFEPRFSHIDILYDAAFAIMDMIYRGEERLLPVMIGRYLSATRDYAGLSALPLFVSTRAGVRALVALLSPAGPETAASARRHLALAAAALRPPPAPRLIAVGGRSGTGKSTLARALAPALQPGTGAVILRSDEIRKRMAGVAPEARLPAASYTRAASDAVYRRMARDGARALAAGATVILDAAFLAEAERAAARAVAARAGAAFTGLWLTAPDAVLQARIGARKGDASDADVGVMRRQQRTDSVEGWTTLEAGGDLRALTARALIAIEDRAG